MFKLSLACFVLIALVSNWTFALEPKKKDPTVLTVLLVRNKAHTLPYFLTLFEQLDYPKDRMALWIRSDHNRDNSIPILTKWVKTVENSYHHINISLSASPSELDGTNSPTEWSEVRFRHIINLREEALRAAREMWVDYVWFVDCDAFLTNPQSLKHLVSQDLTIVAPKLESLGMYSNFWCGMTTDYYYRRTEEYKPILDRKNKGCHKVIMVHSCVLVDLRRQESNHLTFVPEKLTGYEGPKDDIITFAISAFWNDIPMVVCNDEIFGFLMNPLQDGQELEDDFLQLLNIKMEASALARPLTVSALFAGDVSLPVKDKMDVSEIFLINLDRRPERKERMEYCFDELGLNVKRISAVDGRQLNNTYLDEMGIQMLPNFADPRAKRPLTMGEIGCFLSHYKVWQETVARNLSKVLIFEDDIRFEPFFRYKFEALVREADALVAPWDLIYLGRKRLKPDSEGWVDGARFLSTVDYSYWTLSYMLTQSGARKLLEANPLPKLVPVDEYLPIMFDRHPEERWKVHFPHRNLKAYSAAEFLVYPTHYTGEEGYVSDTETSSLVTLEESSLLEPNPGKGDKEEDLPLYKNGVGEGVASFSSLEARQSHTEL